LNLHHTLERLLEFGVVPIINENDTVSTKELAYGNGDVFGDNDRLSALVASRVEADLLVLLTDVDGVFTAHPKDPESALLRVYEVGSEVETSSSTGSGRGGMKAKIEAATVASMAGVTVVIANGAKEGSLRGVCSGIPTGTLFEPRPVLNSRKRWLAFATSPQGVIMVNDGARNALVDSHASLLPKGVVGATGDFSVGDTISIASSDGTVFARGVTNFSRSQTIATKGRHPADLSGRGRERMVVHCENLVILEEVGS
jgi:glutamate 5-kinase